MRLVGEILDEMLREVFEERAAIIEFDGGKPREDAEKLAKEEVVKLREQKEFQ